MADVVRARQPRRRRRPADVRRELIAHAQHLFDTKGFAATTMKDISVESGIAVSVLYRHFPTKAELLREAALAPFLGFIDSFGAMWHSQERSPLDEVELMRLFIADLYAKLVEHRGVLLTMVAARNEFDQEMESQISVAMRRMFMELRGIGESEAQTRGWFSPARIELTVRLTVAMVVGTAVFSNLLIPQELEGSDELIDHTANFVLWGLRLERPGVAGDR